MRRHYTRLLSLAGLILVLLPLTLRAHAAPSRQTPAPSTSGDRLLLLIENVGQYPQAARYFLYGSDHPLWLTEDAIWITVPEQTDRETRRLWDKEMVSSSPPHLVSPSPQEGVNIKLSFVGANPHPRLEPFGRLPTHVSYFYGSDPAGWHADAPVWSGVRYVDLYPGVDLEVIGVGGQWAWQMVTRSTLERSSIERDNALRDIRLHIEGASDLALDNGVLHLATAAGDLSLPPLTAEGLNVERSTVNVQRMDDGAFDLSPPFSLTDPAGPLQSPTAAPESKTDTLQPSSLVLPYAIYLGGYFDDAARDVAVDSAGHAYVVGSTRSPNFPTTPGVSGEFFSGGDYDAFVAKLNPTGTALEYATFLGGIGDDRGNDFGYGIAIDAADNAYVTGWTDSDKFPVTSGAYDSTFNGIPHLSSYDAFVAKLNANGTALSYATYLGGRKDEQGIGVAVDGTGNAYVTGWTDSTDFPAVAADSRFDTYHGGSADVFVAKLNGAGTNLDYSMLVGGGKEEIGYAVAVNSSGYACVTGVTQSSDFPRRLALDYGLDGPSDAFAMCVRPSGESLFSSTYLGGSNGEIGYDIAVDPAGNAYIAGGTDSNDFPVTDGAFDTTYNGGARDAFVVKLGGSGRIMTYASYLGYGGDEQGYGIAADSAGNAYVTGPIGNDTVSKIDSAGARILFRLSDSEFTHGLKVAVDAVGGAYIVGKKNNDGWVAKAAEPSYVSGKVTDRQSRPLVGIQIVVGGKYTVTTDSDGLYALVLPAGAYTVTPATPGYFWSPASRTLSIPPAATNQDFTGSHLQKQVTPAGFTEVTYGNVLTYTVGVLYTTTGTRLFYDAVPTYTTYLSGSLSGPEGVAYDAGANAIRGALSITAAVPATVTFAARVVVTGTAGLAPTIVNRACVRPEGSDTGSCDWSNEARSYTSVWPVYLPLVRRE